MNSRTIGIIMVVLIIIIGVFALINKKSLAGGKEALERAQIIFKYDDLEFMLDFDYLSSLEEKEFTAVLDTSSTDPTRHNYTGLALYKLLEDLNIDTNNIRQVVVRGVDGYTVALTPSEVMDKDNIYIAYKQDGKPLKTKGKGGVGPYQVVIRKDQFSQRWCKFLVEIEVK